jgi:LysM repeat protein
MTNFGSSVRQIAVVTLRAVGYPGADITVMLNGDTPRLDGGIAKYNQVARPRRRDSLEFDSEDPLKLNFGVMFDAFPDGEVESLVGRLYGWAAKVALDEPPIVHVSGPLPYTQLDYKITKITDDGVVERRADGLRCRQELKLELTEFVAEDIIVANVSPVAAAVTATSTSTTSTAPASSGTVTVKKGDTLYGIARAKLGNGNRWPEIASKNGIRDPKRIQPGQVLQLP